MREHTKKYTDFSVKININKNIESLNISNSAAIVFHHINQFKIKLDNIKNPNKNTKCPVAHRVPFVINRSAVRVRAGAPLY